MEALLALIGVVVGLAGGAAIVWLLMRGRMHALVAQSTSEREALRSAALAEKESALALAAAAQESALAAERARAAEATAAVQAELAAARSMVDGLREQLDALRTEALAQKEREKQEAAILERLAPVAKSIADMKERVEAIEEQRKEQHVALAQQLVDTRLAGEQIRQSAAQLREVLKSNNQRGRWGELQLRSVAEAAGMLDRVNFDTQSTFTADGKRSRPDMIVHLPGGKTIAVDSKVPFAAYLEAADIPITASEAELARRDALIKQHVRDVRKHVDSLSDKSYWTLLDTTPEMVVAFIPSESLLGAALEADPDILEYAFGKHVALASPVTLFSVLKAIAVSWTHEEMSTEARGLFDVSRTMYQRLVKLAETVDKLGRSLTTSVKDYNAFMASFEGSVLPHARKLSRLDETKVLPSLSELDANVREISKSDLVEQLELTTLELEPATE